MRTERGGRKGRRAHSARYSGVYQCYAFWFSHVLVPQGEGGLSQDSKALTEQIRAMDKQRLTTKIGTLSERFLRLLEQAIRNSLDM